MSFSPECLAERLASLAREIPEPARYLVAFSGGLDSTVLIHALAALQQRRPVIAVHVDHALQPGSAEWQAHCRDVAAELGIEFHSKTVEVADDSGLGPEAAAREARYAALSSFMHQDDWLLSAHHRDDQAETLLLNLIRGSGPVGVAGIPPLRLLGQGWLVRPMLDVSVDAMRDYASRHALSWVDDPSNADIRFQRNFLRHEILPSLRRRWPDIGNRLQRSAGHAREASDLLRDLAKIDLAALGGDAERLRIGELLLLSPARQRNVIRYALRVLQLPTPTAAQLACVQQDLLQARDDSQPQVAWPGAVLRRYRGCLYLSSAAPCGPIRRQGFSAAGVDLGRGLGRIRLVETSGEGIDPALAKSGLTLSSRAGGERIRLKGQAHRKKLKKLLQEEGVVPWMRDRLPLLYAGDQLVAVADLWIAADAVSKPGFGVRWDGRPALH